MRQERRFLGAEIASTIESQGGAITPEGSEELAQVISDTILKELDESIPTVNISLRPSAILDRGLFKNQLLYALSPLLDPQTNFSVTLRDAVSENSTSFASLARLESACIHLINNLPNEVPTDLIDLYSNLVNRTVWDMCTAAPVRRHKKLKCITADRISCYWGLEKHF